MKTLISNARVIDPASKMDRVVDVAFDKTQILHVGDVPADFGADCTVDGSDCLLLPGLIDLSTGIAQVGVKGTSGLDIELSAAVATGVTSVVCTPDSHPVLDEAGLVDILCTRARNISKARLFPLGALTPQLAGGNLTEMHHLAWAGCIGFSQANLPIFDLQILRRAMQYASTFDFTVWHVPQDPHLAQGGYAASGSVATALGLATIPVSAETIALHTIFDLMRTTDARVHLCRISSAAGVDLIRDAKKSGLPLTCDVSLNTLHLTDMDIGYFDSRARLTPPLRQQHDKQALRHALADGTIDALVSNHTLLSQEDKATPFGDAKPGASGVELLLGLTLKWAQEDGLALSHAFAAVTSRAAQVLAQSSQCPMHLGQIKVGYLADLTLVDPNVINRIDERALRSKSRFTPHHGAALPGQVRATWVEGRAVFTAEETLR